MSQTSINKIKKREVLSSLSLTHNNHHQKDGCSKATYSWSNQRHYNSVFISTRQKLRIRRSGTHPQSKALLYTIGISKRKTPIAICRCGWFRSSNSDRRCVGCFLRVVSVSSQGETNFDPIITLNCKGVSCAREGLATCAESKISCCICGREVTILINSFREYCLWCVRKGCWRHQWKCNSRQCCWDYSLEIHFGQWGTYQLWGRIQAMNHLLFKSWSIYSVALNKYKYLKNDFDR